MQMHGARYEAGSWSPKLPDFGDGTIVGFAFGGSGFVDDPTPFRDLSDRYPGITLVGCSSSGEIFGDQITDETVTVALIRLEETSVRVVSTPIADASESAVAGARLGADLAAGDLAGVVILSDGLAVNGSMLAEGVSSQLREGTVVTGGLAGDGDRFERTWVLVDGEPKSGHVTALGLYGEAVRFGFGSAGGWQQFGPIRHVTRAEGNVLYELDGQPALELYKSYLGERADGLPATALLFPLLVEEEGGRSLVRTILAVNEDDQSMVFAGDVQQGASAQLMRASFDNLVDGAEDAASQLDRDAIREPALCLAVSCVGRRLVLGEECEEEIEVTLGALPGGSLQVGFYSYGELSPTGFSACDLHNQTMTLTTIREVV